jgi:hypothetical protein
MPVNMNVALEQGGRRNCENCDHFQNPRLPKTQEPLLLLYNITTVSLQDR